MMLDLGGNWRYQWADQPLFARLDYDDSDWPTMHIPRNWFLAGLEHHGVVWFRRWFDHEPRPGAYASLRFDGVDYFADVYLNGIHLGHHAGYFEPFEFEAGGALRSDRNLLAVRVDSPFEAVGPDGWHMRKKLIKGVLNHHDCRPGGGWLATGQACNTGGIWNRVTLASYGAITIDRLLLAADLDAQPARLTGKMLVTNRGRAWSGQLRIRCRPENFTGESYGARFQATFPHGRSAHDLALPVPGVAIWQPWDRGEPHLYRVTLRQAEAEEEEFEASTTFGFRQIAVDQDYRWQINGLSYFPRGSNYIASQWLSETLFAEAAVSPFHPFPAPPFSGHQPAAGDGRPTLAGWFERDVALMKEANLNLIRVHAHVLPPAFHDACDRAGMLVWQDFPLQWGYSDEPAFVDEAERQLQAMIALLYNHPSIAAWCVHNESPWDAEWMAEEAGGTYGPDHNRELDERLRATARRLDPARHVQLNSGTGDSHVYPGWYYGHLLDFRDLPGAPFPTEYGAQALPLKESLQQIFGQFGRDAGHGQLVKYKGWIDSLPHFALAKELPPIDEVPADLHGAHNVWQAWRFHDFQPAETFYLAGISPGDSLDEFIHNSQAYQAQINQFATEAYRRAKYGQINGLMQFMFVDPWPAVTWAVLDYWRQPRPAYFALKLAMQPVLVTSDINGRLPAMQPFRCNLWVINDLRQDFPGASCRWRLLDQEDNQVDAGTIRFDVAADSISERCPVEGATLAPGSYRLLLALHAAETKLLSQNSYQFKATSPRKPS